MRFEEWNEKYRQANLGAIVVDVRGCSSVPSIVQKFWDALLGPNYKPFETNSSLDALTEVIADFLMSRWGQKTLIFVVGAREIDNVDRTGFLASIVNTLGHAQYIALVSKLRETSEVAQIEPYVYNTHIKFFWR